MLETIDYSLVLLVYFDKVLHIKSENESFFFFPFSRKCVLFRHTWSSWLTEDWLRKHTSLSVKKAWCSKRWTNTEIDKYCGFTSISLSYMGMTSQDGEVIQRATGHLCRGVTCDFAFRFLFPWTVNMPQHKSVPLGTKHTCLQSSIRYSVVQWTLIYEIL